MVLYFLGEEGTKIYKLIVEKKKEKLRRMGLGDRESGREKKKGGIVIDAGISDASHPDESTISCDL